MKIWRNIVIMFVCTILGVMLTWQYKSISYNAQVADFENKRIEDLKDLLLLEKQSNEELRQRNERLEKELSEYQLIRGNIDEEAKLMEDRLFQLRIFSGLEEVKGKGIIITIDNNGPFFTVQDTDILRVLNELRASDAQAISINGERIVAMSEVREAGDYMVVNSQQIAPPYIIKAICDPDKVEKALKILGGIIDNLELYQLKVKIEKSDEIVIPKIDSALIKTDLLTPINN
ncbi:MAG TPA: DUF881 domain-containing protein [Clostridiaceae bacterium]|nr:DUF881 domain-containing protein [Clostridiaceae bacterium]